MMEFATVMSENNVTYSSQIIDDSSVVATAVDQCDE